MSCCTVSEVHNPLGTATVNSTVNGYMEVGEGEGLTLLLAVLVESKYSLHFILEEVVHHFSFRIYTYDH